MTSRIEDEPAWERVRLEWKLRCLSPMHIGNGEVATYRHPNESAEDTRKKGNETEYQTLDICRGDNGLPLIPASSLRGHLLHKIQGDEHDEIRARLFGTARNESEGGSGKVRVYDGLLSLDGNQGSDISATELRTRIAIDPITATAKRNHLFTETHVCKDSCFVIHIECDRISKNDLQVLYSILASLNGTAGSQLGKGKTLLKGLVKTLSIQAKALSHVDFVEWLKEDKELDNYYKKLDLGPSEHGIKAQLQGPAFHLKIHPTAPLLINDIHRVSGKSGEADHVFMSENGRLMIPASSLKGLLRGHCRRILLTLMDSLSERVKTEAPKAYTPHQNVDELLEEIFGSTQQIGRIRISDALSEKKATIHEQTFNAIDRFTGGVSDGALYMSRAGWAESLSMNLILDASIKDQSWIQGLLHLVLRDAMEGDLRIGWGKSRGYGAFRLSVTLKEREIDNWKDWLNEQGAGKVKEAVSALEDKLKPPEEDA